MMIRTTGQVAALLALDAIVRSSPSRSTEPVHHLKLTPWWIAAQVEDDGEPLPGVPPDEIFGRQRMEHLAACYDPSRYRAPIVEGASEGGPAHLIGEKLRPLGVIESVAFDGVHLWVRCLEIVDYIWRNIDGRSTEAHGRLTRFVADGGFRRSIAAFPFDTGKDLAGCLRHVALMTGEVEGQTPLALPPLPHFFPEALAPVDEPVYRSVRDRPFVISRNYLEVPTVEPEKKDEEKETETRVEDPMAAMKVALEELLRPVTAQLETLASEVAGMKTGKEDEAIRSAVRTAGVPDAEVEAVVGALRSVAPEGREAVLRHMRPETSYMPRVEAGTVIARAKAEGEADVRIPVNPLLGVDPDDLDITETALRSLPAEDRDDPEKRRAAIARVYHERRSA